MERIFRAWWNKFHTFDGINNLRLQLNAFKSHFKFYHDIHPAVDDVTTAIEPQSIWKSSGCGYDVLYGGIRNKFRMDEIFEIGRQCLIGYHVRYFDQHGRHEIDALQHRQIDVQVTRCLFHERILFGASCTQILAEQLFRLGTSVELVQQFVSFFHVPVTKGAQT